MIEIKEKEMSLEEWYAAAKEIAPHLDAIVAALKKHGIDAISTCISNDGYVHGAVPTREKPRYDINLSVITNEYAVSKRMERGVKTIRRTI